MIDLRSDTVTRPTLGMLEYMMEAEVGDDVFAEDPTTNQFEEKIAEMFGMEAGLFVPSGTMGNQLCLQVLTNPGDEIIIDHLGQDRKSTRLNSSHAAISYAGFCLKT